MHSQIIKILKDKQNKSDLIFFGFCLPTFYTGISLDSLLFPCVVFITEALGWPDHLNSGKAFSMRCLIVGLGTTAIAEAGTNKRVPWDVDFFSVWSSVH